jgi:hypothetical protein
MVLRPFFVLPIVSVLALAGCASDQSTRVALGLAEELNDLSLKQILSNLRSTLRNPYAVPAQMMPTTAVASSTSQLQGNLSSPISLAETTTDAVTLAASQTTTVVGAATPDAQGTNVASTSSRTPSHSNVRSSAAKTASATATVNWTASWTIDPIVDPDALRRARTLYRYAIGAITTSEEFIREYPLNRTYANRIDEAYLTYPGCVVCRLPGKPGLQINPAIRSGWVSDKEFPESRSLADLGFSDLYVNRERGLADLAELELFLFVALSTQATDKFPSAKSKTFGIIQGH